MSKAQLNELGKLIRRERAKAKLNQRELAEKTGVTHTTILRLERGEFGRPDPGKLERIAHALNAGAGDFFALAGYMHADHLPNLDLYLQALFGDDLSARDRKDIARYVEQKRASGRKGRRGTPPRKEKGARA